MAKRQAEPVDESVDPKRRRHEYFFEDHREDGTIYPLGLKVYFPLDVEEIRNWLNQNRERFGIEGTLKVAKRIYS